MEIERKYQIRYMPPEADTCEKKEIRQAYLSTDPVLRIREIGERYVLTVKAKGGEEKEGSPCINEEVEIPLSRDAFFHLLSKADPYEIHKTRHFIPLDASHVAELDVFHGRLQGLVFVEVEFESVEDSESFLPPDWFGKDVSSDERYQNAWLSRQERWEEE